MTNPLRNNRRIKTLVFRVQNKKFCEQFFVSSKLLLLWICISPFTISSAQSTGFPERKIALAQRYTEILDSRYDPRVKGIWDSNFTTHRTRESAWMAMCYFITGTNIARANDLLKGVMAQQDNSSSDPSKRYNFKWVYEAGSVNDRNAISFIGPVLAYIYMNHYDDLEPDVASALETSLQNGKTCVYNLLEDRIPVTYTNVYINLVAYLVMTGEEINAIPYVDRLYDMIVNSGINEYSSWAYIAVQINGFQAAYSYATSTELKEKLKKLTEFHWYDFVHNIHKQTDMVSSVAARAKDKHGMIPSRDIQSLEYLYFGANDISRFVPGVEALMTDYYPPLEVISIYNNKTYLEYQTANSRVDIKVYQTPAYSLSTQSGRRSVFSYGVTYRKDVVGHETEEHDIQMVYDNGLKPYWGIKFHTYDVNYLIDDFDHRWITSVQHKNKAIVSYNFDPQGISDDRIYSEAVLGIIENTLAPNGDYSGFKIDGSTWDGQNTSLPFGTTIAFTAGSAFIGIKFLHTDVISIDGHSICTNTNPIALITERASDGQHQVLLQSYLAHFPSDYRFTEKDRRLGYYIEMADTSEYISIDHFSNHMLGITVAQDLDTLGIHEVTVTSGSDILSLKEDLSRNVMLSRRVNGHEFNNKYLLRSKYATLEVGNDLGNITIDTAGSLHYPPPVPEATEYKYLEFEAENMILDGSMVKEVLNDASNSYVIKPTINGDGSAGVILDIPHTGEWYVWSRVNWNSTNENSIYLSINKAEVYVNYLLTDNKYDSLHWISNPNPYLLHRGRHTLKFEAREAGAMLDKVIVTNDPSYGNHETRNLHILYPIEDAFVRDGDYSDSNFGSNEVLDVKNTESPGYNREAYLKFDLSGIQENIVDARVQLSLKRVGSSQPDINNKAVLVRSDGWNESSITWNNKPYGADEIANWDVPSLDQSRYIEFDVTPVVQGQSRVDGVLSLKILSSEDVGANGEVSYWSKENGSSDSHIPQLIVLTDKGLPSYTCNATEVSGDTTRPVIVCPEDLTTDCGTDIRPDTHGIAYASDNCADIWSIDIHHNDFRTQGSDVLSSDYYNYDIIRTWYASDLAGNTAECNQLITIQDTILPVITCPEDKTVTYNDDLSPYVVGYATALDNCTDISNIDITWNDISSQGSGPNSEDYKNFMIDRTWRATDPSGNFKECTQVITVQEALSVENSQMGGSQITIYPNPNDNIINLNGLPSNQNVKIVIYNVFGVQILKQRSFTEKVEIDVTGLAPGIYYLSISMNGNKAIKRFVKC